MEPNLDPQELLDHEYNPETDITAEAEQSEYHDDGYEPELAGEVDFDDSAWPADELVITDIDEEGDR